MEINRDIEFNSKQAEAYRLLNDFDNGMDQIFYGGAAGGGKTFLLCYWVIESCLKYPGSRYALAREELKALRETTWVSLLRMLYTLGIYNKVVINDQKMQVYFPNKSSIVSNYLSLEPSDPLGNRLGGLEISGAGVDEGGEISHRMFEVLSTRVRFFPEGYGMSPKILIVSNPTNNFLKREFYTPAMSGALEKNKSFVGADKGDNPFIHKDYLKNLKDPVLRRRLILGDWDFDIKPNSLLNGQDLHKNITSDLPHSNRYASVDVADIGGDKSIMAIISDNVITHVINLDTVEVQYSADNFKVRKDQIIKLLDEYNIRADNCYIDATGVGLGLYNNLLGAGYNVRKFIGAGNDIKSSNFQLKNNRQTCYWIFRNLILNGTLRINENVLSEELIQEVSETRFFEAGGGIEIEKKENVKRILGRSPDTLDAITMACGFLSTESDIDWDLYLKFI